MKFITPFCVIFIENKKITFFFYIERTTLIKYLKISIDTDLKILLCSQAGGLNIKNFAISVYYV